MNQGLLANTAISLFGHLFFMVPLIWIVIIIEMFYIRNATQCSRWRAFGSCTIANLASTFGGIPVTWLLTLFISVPSLYSVSVILDKVFPGFENNTSLVLSMMFGYSVPIRIPGHMELFASIFLLIPYYYMSVFIENLLVRLFYPQIEPGQIKKAVVRMNRVTYLFLGALMLAVFVIGELLTDKQ